MADAQPREDLPQPGPRDGEGDSALKVAAVQACFECRFAGGMGHVEEACHDQRGQFQARSASAGTSDRIAVHRGPRRAGEGPHVAVCSALVPSSSRSSGRTSRRDTALASPRSRPSTTTPRRGHTGPGSATTPGRWSSSERTARPGSLESSRRQRTRSAASRAMRRSCGSWPYTTSPPNGPRTTMPVSVLEGSGVIVTEYVEGGRRDPVAGGAPRAGEPARPPAQTARGRWCGRAGRRVGGARRRLLRRDDRSRISRRR